MNLPRWIRIGLIVGLLGVALSLCNPARGSGCLPDSVQGMPGQPLGILCTATSPTDVQWTVQGSGCYLWPTPPNQATPTLYQVVICPQAGTYLVTCAAVVSGKIVAGQCEVQVLASTKAAKHYGPAEEPATAAAQAPAPAVAAPVILTYPTQTYYYSTPFFGGGCASGMCGR